MPVLSKIDFMDLDRYERVASDWFDAVDDLGDDGRAHGWSP